MEHEVKKVAKIVDEIITYFLNTFGCPSFQLKYNHDETAFRLEFTFEGVAMEPRALERLREKLTAHRQTELEDYYWQLTGESEDDNELALVAMMSDDIDLEHDSKTLRLKLRRDR